ncbi:alpha/beta hydrolase family protein [Ruminiclostridium papyrosolvens]|uniref:alpha/beta hydrolase family protein n=1 Tax=Ruminiclostridium papyrosolvens TaxID=29362 RepID=UPI00040FB925|nr:alpha/beta fold hydrolase [Ruminiclostridium papyrosolvens]
MQTNSFINAQVLSKSEKYPVLIFSHSMTGFRNQNTFQSEELASHGYIVVAVDHPYYAAATVFSDGRVAESTISTDVNSNDFSLEFGDKNNDTWVRDVEFVLDKLEEINNKDNDNLFSGRFDMEKIGVFGHSFGGATAAQLLLKDSRVKAGINMDGTFYGSDIPETGLEKPFLLMLSEQYMMSTDLVKLEKKLKMFGIKGEKLKEYLALYAEYERRRKKAMAGGAYSLIIKKTTHLSYSDIYLYTPLMALLHKPKKVHRVIIDFTLTFFNKYLMEDSTASLENAALKYNNVEIAGTKKELVF